MTNFTIGVDVSKDELVVHRLPDGTARQFTNDKSGHRALIAWLAKTTTERVVYEPTGPYHRELERTLAKAGLPLVKVNPRQARRFAEATGRLAKTDRVDAAMLARMGLALELEARPVAGPILRDLNELHAARNALVKDRTAAKNRAKGLTLSLLKRRNAQRLKQIEADIRAVEAAIDDLMEGDDSLSERLEILMSIPGIAKTTAQALLLEMPELGSLDNKQVASLAGLAPITRQSGKWRGQAYIRGGRSNLRQALYMPALVAMRFNPDLKAIYERLTANGKPPKKAVTAVMRKLIILANALLRDERMWQKVHA